MVSIESVINDLRLASLFAETSPSNPNTIYGGTIIENVNGIKIYHKGFSIQKNGEGWLVKLPRGQFIDDYSVKNASDIAPLIANYYRAEGWLT